MTLLVACKTKANEGDGGGGEEDDYQRFDIEVTRFLL